MNGSLNEGDCQFGDDTYYDWYCLTHDGGDLSIQLNGDFDEYLIVFSPVGEVYEVDQYYSGESFFQSDAQAGVWGIIANSYEPATGDYELCVE